jgi:acyl-CoA reductase-like NAD-dependent aldehyde dehydrogenase
MTREYKMYIGGQWMDANDHATFDDFNPYSGEVYAKGAAGTRAGSRFSRMGGLTAGPAAQVVFEGRRHLREAAGRSGGGFE